jgi:FixJ family two-component response regulator
MASGRSTIFIIDDDSSVRRALGRVMAVAGLDWKSFACVEDFLAAVGPGDTGCIIVDVVRPGLDSVDLKQQLDAARLRLPLIILTANDTAEAQAAARDAGAVAFFRKPVDSNALLDAVRWATQAPARKQANGGF